MVVVDVDVVVVIVVVVIVVVVMVVVDVDVVLFALSVDVEVGEVERGCSGDSRNVSARTGVPCGGEKGDEDTRVNEDVGEEDEARL